MAEKFKKDFARLGRIARLWMLGVVALWAVAISLMVAGSFAFAILSQAYLFVFLLAGIIIIPILIALFILPRFGVEA
jgi:hypothetical protein